MVHVQDCYKHTTLHGGKLFLENYSNPLLSAVLTIRVRK